MAKTYQGLYKLINPKKYKGNPNNVTYRSSWEKRFFIWCDTNGAIIEWSSEETVVPYVCGTDGRFHRYFVDALIKIRDVNGNVNAFLVEIKPYRETQKPEYKGKMTKRYLYECETYIKNKSKWEAAEKYAAERGMKFIILTEYELGLDGSQKSTRANSR